MNLKEKTVLVTGGAKRIGRVIAKSFAEKGSNLVIHYNSSESEAKKLIQEIKEMKVEVVGYQADLSKYAELKGMTRKILADLGGVDVIVNSASAFFKTPLPMTTEAEWDQLLAVNLKAPFFLSQHLAPPMKTKGEGRIINIADWAGLKPYKDYLPYCISKAGLIAMTQGLAKTLAPEILVTAVCPGPVLPPPDFSEEEKRKIAKQTLVGRWGNPEDIAKMVVFLAESDFITGHYYLVEGGELLKG